MELNGMKQYEWSRAYGFGFGHTHGKEWERRSSIVTKRD